MFPVPWPLSTPLLTLSAQLCISPLWSPGLKSLHVQLCFVVTLGSSPLLAYPSAQVASPQGSKMGVMSLSHSSPVCWVCLIHSCPWAQQGGWHIGAQNKPDRHAVSQWTFKPDQGLVLEPGRFTWRPSEYGAGGWTFSVCLCALSGIITGRKEDPAELRVHLHAPFIWAGDPYRLVNYTSALIT